MSFKVNKLIYLLLGLVLGFFVGGGIIWWQINQEKKFMNDKSDINNTYLTESNNIPEKNKVFKKKYQKELLKFKIPPTFIDTLKLDSGSMTIQQLIDLYSKIEVQDTSGGMNTAESDIVISKDQMLSAKMVLIRGEVKASGSEHDLDSILIDSKSIKKDKRNLRVEFWRSPINYRGYKYDDIKLVVFGLLEYDNLSLLKYKNQLYIKYNKEYYPVEFTYDFKPFVTIKENSLIKELNAI